MALFNSGIMIRELRNGKGLTQAQLAEGICSRQTITAIEKGERKPDWYTFTQILRKLDVPPDRYFDSIANEDEVYVHNKLIQWNDLASKWNYEALKAEFAEAEQDKRFRCFLGQQNILRMKGVYHNLKGNPEQDFALSVKCRLEFLTNARPGFDIDKIDEYFLTMNERIALNGLCNSYDGLGEPEKSLLIRDKLMKLYEKNHSASDHMARVQYMDTIVNQASTLLDNVKRYEECIALADKGLKIAKGDNYSTVNYMYLIKIKASAHMRLGQKEEGEELVKRFLYFAYAMGENQPPPLSFEVIKKQFEDIYGYRLDLTLPW
jgi:transcriptional regulator with XRE-family HTH domain